LVKVVPRGSPPSCSDKEEAMIDPFVLRIEFFEGLVAIDEAIVERAAAELK
jgi:hypothetical protein